MVDKTDRMQKEGKKVYFSRDQTVEKKIAVAKHFSHDAQLIGQLVARRVIDFV